MKSLIRNKKGSAIFMTIMLLAGMMTISFGAANLVTPGIIMSRTQNYSTNAFFAAEAGAERSLWEYRKNQGPWPQFTPPAEAVFGNLFGTTTLGNTSQYVVDYASSTPEITMTSKGYYFGSRRTVEVNFTQ